MTTVVPSITAYHPIKSPFQPRAAATATGGRLRRPRSPLPQRARLGRDETRRHHSIASRPGLDRRGGTGHHPPVPGTRPPGGQNRPAAVSAVIAGQLRDPTGGDGRDARLRLGVVGRASLRRLLDVSRRDAGLSYLAGRTSSITLGTGAVILPWNDPLRVAEKITMLDHLAEGRLVFGMGRGLARMEYAGFRQDMNEARERSDEGADDHLGPRNRGDGERWAVLPAAARGAAAASVAFV